MKLQKLKMKRRLVGAALLAFVALVWASAFLALKLFEPSVAQWTLIVTAAAIATEVAMWAGVALLGWTALDRFRVWKRLRRD